MKSKATNAAGSLPHFVCIGAQKAATTWLHALLERHPDIWVPPVKELQHFNSMSDGQLTIYRQRKRVHQLQSAAKKALKGTKGETPDMDKLAWMADYCLDKVCSDDWYEGLFAPGADKICGEITPSYATLDDEQVAAIRRRWPDLKVIFIMREPTERALSGLKEKLGNKKKRLKKVEDQQVLEMLDSPFNTNRTDYRKTLQTWEKHFPKEQLLYLFYDQVKVDPLGWITSALRFLGASTDCAASLIAKTEKANVSPSVVFSPAVRLHLARKYEEQTVWLANHLGGAALQWKVNLEASLNNAM